MSHFNYLSRILISSLDFRQTLETRVVEKSWCISIRARVTESYGRLQLPFT